ncbi:MAG: acyl-CoA synthetase [Pseudomonadota bacterium]
MNVPDLNFGDLFDALAEVIPDRPAIIFGEQSYDWRTFDARSNRLARTLLDRGLQTGAKVAFYLRNSPAYVELFAACAKARLTHANINYLYVEEELHYVLDNADAEAVVYDAEFAPQIERLRQRLPKVRAFLEVGDAPPSDWAESYAQACEIGVGTRLNIERSGEDLYFMYTGGTTGYPKAVMWEHKHRIKVIGMSEHEDAESHAQATAHQAGGIVLPACPLMHSTGFTTTVSALMSGSCVVLLPSRSFDPAVCLKQIERHRVNRLAIVGDAFSVPILEYLAEARAYDLSSVELISSAGAMWSAERKHALLDHFTNATLSDSLGSSEGSRLGSSTTTPGERSATARFKLGPDVKVFTEDLREVIPGSGESGMIATSGSIPLGYYKDPERTAQTFPTVRGTRYSMAGDWCTIEADGSMTLLGRGNNCINSGGEKVYPEEVEEALKLHPEIDDVAVIGVADARWGQAVTAVILARDNREIDQATMKAHLAPLIARYKHPKTYVLVDQRIRHDNGKVNYRAVRRLAGVD